jgi:hypothetical protein
MLVLVVSIVEYFIVSRLVEFLSVSFAGTVAAWLRQALGLDLKEVLMLMVCCRE